VRACVCVLCLLVAEVAGLRESELFEGGHHGEFDPAVWWGGVGWGVYVVLCKWVCVVGRLGEEGLILWCGALGKWVGGGVGGWLNGRWWVCG
jgi:hypothetical protein